MNPTVMMREIDGRFGPRVRLLYWLARLLRIPMAIAHETSVRRTVIEQGGNYYTVGMMPPMMDEDVETHTVH